jgi:hypothetical protein
MKRVWVALLLCTAAPAWAEPTLFERLGLTKAQQNYEQGPAPSTQPEQAAPPTTRRYRRHRYRYYRRHRYRHYRRHRRPREEPQVQREPPPVQPEPPPPQVVEAAQERFMHPEDNPDLYAGLVYAKAKAKLADQLIEPPPEVRQEVTPPHGWRRWGHKEWMFATLLWGASLGLVGWYVSGRLIRTRW